MARRWATRAFVSSIAVNGRPLDRIRSGKSKQLAEVVHAAVHPQAVAGRKVRWRPALAGSLRVHGILRSPPAAPLPLVREPGLDYAFGIVELRPVRYDDATLLVLAHGSTANAASAVPALFQVAALRERRLFATVRECYWQQAPQLAEVLATTRSRRVFVVPLFTGEGYFVNEVIPRALGLKTDGPGAYPRTARRGDAILHYCRPVGTHPGMTDVLLARAQDVVAKHPFPRPPRPTETALFVVGHGTERTRASRTAVESQVRAIRARELYAEVHAAFMEAAPRISECWTVTDARHLVVVPFFISDGLHVVEDIPVLLGESEATVQRRVAAGQAPWRNPTERHGQRLWYAPGIGHEPLLTEVILQRVAEAAAWDPDRPIQSDVGSPCTATWEGEAPAAPAPGS